MKPSTFVKAIAAATLAIAGSAQAATVIDFDAASVAQLTHTTLPAPFNILNVYYGGSYMEDGYQLQSWGPFNLPGALVVPDSSNALFAPAASSYAMAATIGATTTLSKVGGGAFSLNSIDLTRLLAAGGSNRLLTFTGIKADATVVTQSFTFTAGWSTYNFSGFNNLASVSWDERALLNRDFQFDNINVSAVPEPETYAMLGGGLGLLAFMSRRKKA